MKTPFADALNAELGPAYNFRPCDPKSEQRKMDHVAFEGYFIKLVSDIPIPIYCNSGLASVDLTPEQMKCWAKDAAAEVRAYYAAHLERNAASQ